MNIIRFTTRIYPDIGGPARYTYMLSKYLSSKVFQLFNITCKPKRDYLAKRTVNSNFTIYYMPVIVPSEDDNILKKLTFISKFVFYSIKKILKLHRKYRIDLIHCDNPPITGIIAALFARLFKIPFIYTQHGPKIDSPYFFDYLLEARLVYRFSSYYIMISKKYKRYYEKANINTKKLIWIPNGVEINNFFRIQNKEEKKKMINDLDLSSILDIDDFIIICIGYMNKKLKTDGMIDLIFGFSKFLNTININQKKKIKLLFIGDGKYREEIENNIHSLDLSKNIFMLGIRKGINNFYAISDLFALTSHFEAFPTVFLEAVASKIPCISTDVGEVKEILDNNSLVPVGDRDEIANKLERIFKDKEFSKKIVENSFKKIKKFDWKEVSRNIKKIYIETISKNFKKT